MYEIFREFKTEITFSKTSYIDFPAHVHEDFELVYVIKGKGEVICDGKKYFLKNNSYFLSFPNQVHQYLNCGKGDYIILIMKPTDLLGFSEVFQKGKPISSLWQPDNNEDSIPYLLNAAVSEFSKEGHTTVVAAYLTAAIGKLLRNYEIDTALHTNDTVHQILTYCSKHYKDAICIQDIANALHFSKSFISHTFCKDISINFCDYINSLRINDAVKLLKNKKYTVTQVAYLTGFSTIRTFNRVFKAKYGITPTEYRKKNE